MLNQLKGILYDSIFFLATKGARKKKGKRLLLVKPDEIGDYILWRNLMGEIKKSERYRDFTIYLCGNNVWKSLFELFDKDTVDNAYWLNKKKFKKNLLYRYRFLRTIYKENFTVVINPLYSRSKRIDDAVVIAARAETIIGVQGNQESIASYEVGYDKSLYTQLFIQPQKPLFDFYHYRYFMEYVTGNNINVNNTAIDASLLPDLPAGIPDHYAVIVPGSGHKKRLWPLENFIEIANFLYSSHKIPMVICGSTGDMQLSMSFCEKYKHPAVNLTGRTSLPEMLSILNKAKCLISIDTGAIHLAASVNCPVFGIFNGSQYGRFAPYPAEVNENIFPVYPEYVEQEVKDPELLKTKYEYVIYDTYSDISAGKVIEKLKQMIPSPFQ